MNPSTQQTTTEIELLTPDEVAELLRCSKRQVLERLVKRTGFPQPLNPRIMGSLKRWKKEDMLNWINNNGR
ncbi:MAG: helix-turn-helix domain-containing protein [Gammaproteobacteria bacterium]|nr:helix-turn-helix domain-containing protein [Gammaproteobacteria bacterium]